MKKIFTFLLLSAFILTSCNSDGDSGERPERFGIVIHGGAGSMVPGKFTAEQETEYRIQLNKALAAGYKILREGGNSVDAVEAAINVMEDSPLFNAGKGAVFTAAGTNEMDASIMDGKTLNAGAIAEVRHIKNPISTAKMVMQKSKHVMLVGEGAEQFAGNNGVEMVDTSYFFTQERWDTLQELLKSEEEKKKDNKEAAVYKNPDWKFGTVGAVALDKNGNLAAGTSTGGLTGKLYGRVGDSPIIGAGTYADNNTCAVSCTGEGEYFIRLDIAHDISAQMAYENKDVSEAADNVINKKLKDLGGLGGVICMDRDGNFTMTFNTDGMFRGYLMEDGNPKVFLYGNENKEKD